MLKNLEKTFIRGNLRIRVGESRMEPVLYTVSEAAELLKINRNSVYDLLKKNVIRGLKLGSLKITRAELMKFLEESNGKDLSNLEDIKELTFDK
ncbi:helix-turn-helix domain protein [Clostridium beijerinckii]|nr:helix-turn-helix domain protein [Clostridium beijerinckii]